jgi:hypothetical protein
VNLNVPLDWLDVARKCRMPVQPPHASPRVATPGGEGRVDRMELLSGRFRDPLHYNTWDRRRFVDERQSIRSEGPLLPCPFVTRYPIGGDDDDPVHQLLNYSTSVHCSGMGLTAPPQPLPSDALYLFV